MQAAEPSTIVATWCSWAHQSEKCFPYAVSICCLMRCLHVLSPCAFSTVTTWDTSMSSSTLEGVSPATHSFIGADWECAVVPDPGPAILHPVRGDEYRGGPML